MRNSLEKILGKRGTLSDVKQLEALAGVVTRTSRCGLGQTAANPILTTMRNFPQAWEARLQPQTFLPQVTLREALAEATEVQGRKPVAEEEGA